MELTADLFGCHALCTSTRIGPRVCLLRCSKHSTNCAVLPPQIFLDANTYVRFTNGRYAIPGASSATSLVTPAIVIDAVCDSFSIALTNK